MMTFCFGLSFLGNNKSGAGMVSLARTASFTHSVVVAGSDGQVSDVDADDAQDAADADDVEEEDEGSFSETGL